MQKKYILSVSALSLTFLLAGLTTPQVARAAEGLNQNVFAALAKKVVPSVVNISTAKIVKSPLYQGGPDDPFRRFFEEFFGPGFGGEPMPRRRGEKTNPRNMPKAMSLGTGFIIDPKGLILTNNHVVADADEIKINFTEAPDERPSDGKVVGRDADLDVALIQVKSKREMIPLPLGDSDALEVGEYVMAVGNPFGQGHSVTHGIISAKGRMTPNLPLATYLQTDAPINPGNSGGPLVNLKGEVIGINNAIDARAQGIGFAIPSSSVVKVLAQLKSKGSVERGYMGAMIGDLNPELAEKMGVPKDTRAAFITNVSPGGPAEKAGLKPYDVVLDVNKKKVSSANDLVATITGIPVGETAQVHVSRDGKEMTIPVRLTKRPASFAAADRGRRGGGGGEEREESVETGMRLETLTPELSQQLGVPSKIKGVIVSSLDYGGPADRAGLSRGDVIVEVDRKAVHDVDSFYSIVKSKKSYLLRVLRAGAPQGQENYSVIVLDLKE